MPRITPTRVLKALQLPWIILVAIWLFLPSPTLDSWERDQYVRETLASGKTLTTVHANHKSFQHPSKNGRPGWVTSGEGLIIEWRLISQPKSDSVSLQIGKNLVVNLTDAILKAADNLERRKWLYFSAELGSDVGSGVAGDFINMPWFNLADQLIIDDHMHGMPCRIPVRVVVPEPNTVEIWKGSVADKVWPQSQVHESDHEYGVLASFSNLATLPKTRSSITRIKVETMKGELPSTTYHIRESIEQPVSLMAVIVLGLWEVVISPVLIYLTPLVAVYLCLIFVAWLSKGRPEFSEWRAEFWMTKWFTASGRRKKLRRNQVWGPAGPVHVEEGRLSYDEERQYHDKDRGSFAGWGKLSDAESTLPFWKRNKSKAQGGRFQLG